LTRLHKEGHSLVLWTNSRRERAMAILKEHDLRRFFRGCICREDYDPNDLGTPKDIRRIKGDLLVDDDPDAIRFVTSIGRRGFQISAYRKGKMPDARELERLTGEIGKRGGLLGKFLS
jgi:hypothetical protein